MSEKKFNSSLYQVMSQEQITSWQDHAKKYGFKIGLNEEEIEDVIQATWLVFLSAPENFEGRSKLSTYLFGIFRMKVLETYRRHRKEGDIQKETKNIHEVTSQVPSHDNPEEKVWQGQLRRQFKASVLKLPKKQKSTFVKRHIEFFQDVEVEETAFDKNHEGVLYFRSKKSLQADLRKII